VPATRRSAATPIDPWTAPALRLRLSNHHWRIMTASAVTDYRRCSADIGAALGLRTTTDGLRRFTPDMLSQRRTLSRGGTRVQSAMASNIAFAAAPSGVVHCHADVSALHALASRWVLTKDRG
jgi:hypothetical protein